MHTEVKAGGDAGEIRAAMREFLGAFEAFKDANDERLAQIEAKSAEDAVTTEKVERLNRALTEQKAALDRMALDARRPALSERAMEPRSEAKSAFDRYVRSGDANALNTLEEKAASIGTPADGGYLAPDETERLISARIRDVSPMRQIASVRQIGANTYRKPVNAAGAAAGWVGETDNRPQTDTPTLAPIDFPTMELYAMPAATQALLDDGVVDVEQWLAEEVQAEFAKQEGAAFINGAGAAQPKGLLSYTAKADGTQGFGELGYVATGADGALPSTDPADALIDFVYTVRQAYRANGRFLMNRSTVGALRKLKDGEGNYLWQPSLTAGEAPTLLGYAVSEAEDMPDIASGATAIAFGDFRRGYLIVDRVGVRVLRDPFSAKPYVLFYTTKRVGGGVQDFDAVKLLKFSAS